MTAGLDSRGNQPFFFRWGGREVEEVVVEGAGGGGGGAAVASSSAIGEFVENAAGGYFFPTSPSIVPQKAATHKSHAHIASSLLHFLY